MKYREMALEMLKLMGQELIDRAEELIPNTEGIKDIDVWISIPTMSDSELCIPEIRVNTIAYPKRMALEKFMELNKLYGGSDMQQIPVAPTEVLMVSFDLTHGPDNRLCIVGKKDGKAITIVNAFQGQQAEDIFKLLTTVKRKAEEKKDE